MKTLLLLLALCGIAAAQSANGNSLVGMPEVSITLSGTVQAPVVENHSGRKLVGYTVHFQQADGEGPVYSSYANGTVIVDGGKEPVFKTGPGTTSITITEKPVVKVVLLNVVFADGEFVGKDKGGDFNSFKESLKFFRGLNAWKK